MPLLAGTPAPDFRARSDVNPSFAFNGVGGHFLLLAFTPEQDERREQMLALLEANKELFRPGSRGAIAVIRDEAAFLAQPVGRQGMRYLHDPDGRIARLYKAVDEAGLTVPQWVVVDPSMRVLWTYGFEEGEKAIELMQRRPDPDLHAGVPLHAPVLIVPRVFEQSLCRRLIDYYEAEGGEISGVMKDVGGRTVPVVDDRKRRRDVTITDQPLKEQLLARITARLLPEITKAFMFQATRMERYLVARYDAEEGGYFRAHRDNTTLATAHRQFACSINLNAEEFEGGDLRFAEFGRRTYRPPTGGAVVFSCALLHEATPVTKGTRYAFLPFFYNEEAAKIREANRGFLDRERVLTGAEADAELSRGF
jgi:predicted 2-oxoglutarate/Fe(II)-dependent dioxygenase YbiX/peroxiredoxin